MLIRLRATAPDAATARLMTERLAEPEDGSEALATSSFEDAETGCWQVDAYYSEVPPPETLLARIGGLLMPAASPRIEQVPDENWVAISQAALPPVEAGRFLVHGRHDRQRVGRRRLAIEIDAGEAFGTAHHESTLGCLEIIDRLSRRRHCLRILDLGCGSGVLAIAAARVWPNAAVVASDIDSVAVTVARANAVLNGALRLTIVAASGLQHPRIRKAAPFDLVLANILAGPLVKLAPRLMQVVLPGGMLVLSGLLGEQAREVRAAYAMAGFRLVQRRLRHNWATLLLVRCPSMVDRTQAAADTIVPAARA